MSECVCVCVCVCVRACVREIVHKNCQLQIGVTMTTPLQGKEYQHSEVLCTTSGCTYKTLL